MSEEDNTRRQKVVPRELILHRSKMIPPLLAELEEGDENEFTKWDVWMGG